MLTLQSNNKTRFMKLFFQLFCVFILVASCKKDDGDVDCVSPFLPSYSFDTGTTINMNLPQYSGLQFPGNTVFIASYGVKGIYLYNTGSSVIAVEASDPAHGPNSCSRMTREGIELTCDCGDGNKYQLLTGQQIEGLGGHCLRVYRVENLGDNVIRVFN